MQILVRSANPSDSKHISQFQIEMAWETEHLKLKHSIVKNGVDSVLSDPAKGQYFLAEVNSNIIGSLLVTYEWSDWRSCTILWIQSVYVKPSFRKRGVYAMLYNHVKRIAENDQSYGGIRLYVDNDNLSAQQVYSRMGMNGDHYKVFEWMKK